ncbi:Uncharacterized protein APZ42_002408, partial [Daphnia magna]
AGRAVGRDVGREDGQLHVFVLVVEDGAVDLQAAAIEHGLGAQLQRIQGFVVEGLGRARHRHGLGAHVVAARLEAARGAGVKIGGAAELVVQGQLGRGVADFAGLVKVRRHAGHLAEGGVLEALVQHARVLAFLGVAQAGAEAEAR